MNDGYPRTWQVGSFTVSTHLLPKFYDPHTSFSFVDLEPSALYEVPKSTPSELVAQSLFGGETHVVARVDCAAAWEGIPTEVHRAGAYPYLLVQCGSPSGKLQGILVDAATGATWTLWTDGQAGSDGTLDGEAVVAAGWVYFETYTMARGRGLVQQAMDLATGVRRPIPFPLTQGVWDTLLAPDGTLYAEVGVFKGRDLTSVDLYRLAGPQATLVAHLPGGPGLPGALSIAAHGTIWVTRPGGSLTPDAGAMTIRVWQPTPAPPRSKVLAAAPGYTVSLGAPRSPGADRPVQVTLATSGGVKTIVVGHVADPSDVHDVSVGPAVGVIFPAPHGRWQVLIVSGDSGT